MELMKYPVGTILSIPDHGKMASHVVESRHKYLIVGHSSYRMGMYQCVCITSMYKKEVCNGKKTVIFKEGNWAI